MLERKIKKGFFIECDSVMEAAENGVLYALIMPAEKAASMPEVLGPEKKEAALSFRSACSTFEVLYENKKDGMFEMCSPIELYLREQRLKMFSYSDAFRIGFYGCRYLFAHYIEKNRILV